MLYVSAKNSYTCVTCDSLFAFRRPRDFTLPTSRRGTLYRYYRFVIEVIGSESPLKLRFDHTTTPDSFDGTSSNYTVSLY